MSIIDKAVSAVTPPESETDRQEATERARAKAAPGGWLEMVLDHHERIRRAFDLAAAATGSEARLEAMKDLALVLTGHSLAEEVAVYPAMAKAHEKGHAGMAYAEQTAAKMQMAELERIDPADEAWLDKLEHIRGAVLHHMYEEEGDWFPELQDSDVDQAHIAHRYREEFTRYAGRQ